MSQDEFDSDLARALGEIRVPEGAEARVIDGLSQNSPERPNTARRVRPRAGALALAALLVLAVSAVATVGTWAIWSSDSGDPVAAAYRQAHERFGAPIDGPFSGIRVIRMDYRAGAYEAWVVTGEVGTRLVVIGPDDLTQVRPECLSPWPWPRPEIAQGTHESVSPQEPEVVGGLIAYCGATGDPTRGRGHLIAAVSPQVVGAELRSAGGESYPVAVGNNALLAVFPFAPCGSPQVPARLILRDARGRGLMVLDQDSSSVRQLPARDICG